MTTFTTVDADGGGTAAGAAVTVGARPLTAEEVVAVARLGAPVRVVTVRTLI